MSEASYMAESQMSDWADDDERERRHNDYYESVDAMQAQYRSNKIARVGATIKCACGCGVSFVKANYQSQFAKNKGAGNCKDRFWNNANDKRRKRAQSQKYFK